MGAFAYPSNASLLHEILKTALCVMLVRTVNALALSIGKYTGVKKGYDRYYLHKFHTYINSV